MKVRTATLSLFMDRGARPTARSASRKRVDVDLFAGGGGAGEGKRLATKKSADVALNHWPVAISMYTANHPTTRVLVEDIRNVTPLEATLGALVRYLWASPTCIYFSRASGRRLSPEAVKIRALAEVLIPWLEQTQPEIAIVENVIEFLGWGPVYDTHHRGCPGKQDETGDSCIDACKYGRVIPELKGTLFDKWRRAIERLGYSFEHRTYNAWEFGAPTTRPRVYIVLCRNGRRFEWPDATHCRPEDVAATGLKPWRTAAEIIDWSIPCPSIFDRKTPHVPATRRRVAKGMRKFVLETNQPFLLHLTHGDRHAPHSIDDPVPTVTGANRGEQAVAVPFMIHRSNGERDGQDPRTYDVNAPHPTVVAGGLKTSPVVAFLAKAYTESSDGATQASSLEQPIGTVTAQDHNHLVAAGIVRYHGERRPGEDVRGQLSDEPITTLDASNRFGLMAAHAVKFYGTSTGQDVRGPTHTITANDRGGGHIGIVGASLLRYNGQSTGQRHDEPIGTIDTTDRYAQVQYPIADAVEWNDVIAAKARRVYRFLLEEGVDGPWMDHANQLVRLPAAPWLVIYDIGMRMLVPRELFRANGFSDDYVIELIGPRGKPLTKTEQVRLVGNSVCPDVAAALWRAAQRMRAPRARRAA